MGYARAGFEVVGVDIKPQPNYPFEFVQGDAVLAAGSDWAKREFDAIHASPPCQRYTTLAKQSQQADKHPDLVAATRHRLQESGLPWIIENVPGAPLEAPLMLCGTMFPGLRVIRHRHFETSFYALNPLSHGKHPPIHFKHGNRIKEGTNEWDDFLCVISGDRNDLNAIRDAIGCPWMTLKECAQAIPPAYTEHIGLHLIEHL
jgi:DNA (cytosine-5)-methyltransferase 1